MHVPFLNISVSSQIACQPINCDTIYDIRLFPTVYRRGQKFHSSARIDKWILERTSDSTQSALSTGQVLKSAGETSIF